MDSVSWHPPALPYHPHPLLRNGHLQTLMGGLICGNRPPYQAVQRRVALSDGEQLVVHEELGGPVASDAPLNILIHGLGGDHRSPYLQRIAESLRRAGQRVWRVDLRGCGAGLSLAWRPAHAGASGDVAQVLDAAMVHAPDSPIRVAGFSLSGNILLKLLGEAASGDAHDGLDLNRIEHAIAVAPPIDLAACTANMERWSRRVYTHYYLKMLSRQVQRRQRVWPQWQGISLQPKLTSIRQFDARFTAPLAGFASVDAYYATSSAQPWVEHITTPTFILVDRDDPIVTLRTFKEDQQLPEATRLVLTSHGGHLGYFGLDDSGRSIRWLEHYVVSLLREYPPSASKQQNSP